MEKSKSQGTTKTRSEGTNPPKELYAYIPAMILYKFALVLSSVEDERSPDHSIKNAPAVTTIQSLSLQKWLTKDQSMPPHLIQYTLNQPEFDNITRFILARPAKPPMY